MTETAPDPRQLMVERLIAASPALKRHLDDLRVAATTDPVDARSILDEVLALMAYVTQGPQ